MNAFVVSGNPFRMELAQVVVAARCSCIVAITRAPRWPLLNLSNYAGLGDMVVEMQRPTSLGEQFGQGSMIGDLHDVQDRAGEPIGCSAGSSGDFPAAVA
jgi:hypothetical protein